MVSLIDTLRAGASIGGAPGLSDAAEGAVDGKAARMALQRWEGEGGRPRPVEQEDRTGPRTTTIADGQEGAG